MKLIIALVMVLSLSACGLFYRVPVVQGNVVTAGQVAMLHKGMTKKQVAYILGEPLIESPFDNSRWDYVFYYRNPHAHVRQSALRLYFSNNHLSDIEGDQEYVARSMGPNALPSEKNQMALPGETAAMASPGDSENKPLSGVNTGSQRPSSSNEPDNAPAPQAPSSQPGAPIESSP